LTTYHGKIWGLVLFAHGSKFGEISSPLKSTDHDDEEGVPKLHQSDLILFAASQHYQLAKLYLMQCYSGYKGEFSFSQTMIDEYIKRYKLENPNVDFSHMTQDERWQFYKEEVLRITKTYFNNCQEYSINAYISGESVIVNVTVNWEAEWSRYVVGGCPFLYKGMNFIAFDTRFF